MVAERCGYRLGPVPARRAGAIERPRCVAARDGLRDLVERLFEPIARRR